uniref:FYVE-type domain-containing protein n=1 Tax=Globisporangium ultimum (strain ATCC 200006 / CBS 805.95 / DAOM BR144) TaxID=431595 RepID=K3WXF1_GLOUD
MPAAHHKKETHAPVTFPLPEDKIPFVTLSEADVNAYRKLAKGVISSTLEQEIKYRYRDQLLLDPHEWKFVKSKERMRVYKRIATSDNMVPMVLGVGFIEGTLEDALYGLHHKTTDEMRTTSQYINKHILDTAVLQNFELGTDEDPFRYLGLKWRVAETPGGHLIKNRDVCNLERMGIDTDSQGIRYGFQLLKSVEAPGFEPFPESIMVRAQMMLCCIFRQVTPNVVAFYSKGVFNLCGNLAEFMAFNTCADMVLSISKVVDCAAAKRLTTMVINQQRNKSQTPHKSQPQHSRSVRLLGSAGRDVFKSTRCALCTRKPSIMSSPCRPCKICMTPVCNKCYVKTYVLAKPQKLRIVCCKNCIMKSREFPVDPRDPYPLLHVDDEDRTEVSASNYDL